MKQWDKKKKRGNNGIKLTQQILAKGAGGSAYRRSSILGKEEARYYQALAKQKLGFKNNNQSTFNDLVTIGISAGDHTEDAVTDNQRADQRRSPHEREATSHYIAGLGYAGLGNKIEAREAFNSALNLTPDFLSAKIALRQLRLS